MLRRNTRRWLAPWRVGCLAVALVSRIPADIRGQEASAPAPPVAVPPAAPAADDRPLPITLPVALQLANVRPLEIATAAARLQIALAQMDRARLLWLPTIQVGADYLRHDGRIQAVAGDVFDTSRSSVLIGAGPTAVFALSDALMEPLAARQIVRARQADRQTAANDSLLAVGEAYFQVQQARGELAGAEDAARRAEELVRRTEQLTAVGVEIIPTVEVARAKAELARRRQSVLSSRERWRLASADLVRVLRLEAAAVVDPLEPPHLQVSLVSLDQPIESLIALGLTNRPELAAQQALVQATLQRWREERVRPLLPSVLLRGAATNPAGTLAGGVFGGGRNDSVNHFGARGDFDVQILWELQNLGLGNRARIDERKAEHQLSHLELNRLQDRVVAEVTQALAQARSAAARVPEAEAELKAAVESVEKNFAGMRQPRGTGPTITLVNRPQEVVAAIQTLATAYADYYGAVGDHNRAQFRLYRALGHPANAAFLATPAP